MEAVSSASFRIVAHISCSRSGRAHTERAQHLTAANSAYKIYGICTAAVDCDVSDVCSGWALADSVSSDCTIVKFNLFSGSQQYTAVSPLSALLPKHNCGFPYYNMACCLGVRTIKSTGEYTGQVEQ